LECESFTGTVAGPATGVDLLFFPLDPPDSGTAPAATVLTFSLLTGATPTDAAASCRVHFVAIFRDSTIGFSKP
ncbi:MAG TPA: hypothetical protein VKU44_00745, partial [Terriglobia bacterium]|nr:hypothetical protein [Terriglobia bacterium]